MGSGKGKRYACNFPLREGITDENYQRIFEPVRFHDITGTELIPITGNNASHGIVPSGGNRLTMRNRLAVWRQTWVSEFVDAR